MKKVLRFLMPLGVLLILTVTVLACGGGDVPAEQGQQEPQATNTPTATRTTGATGAATLTSTRAALVTTPRPAQTVPAGGTGRAQVQTPLAPAQVATIPPTPEPTATPRPRPKPITKDQASWATDRSAMRALYEATGRSERIARPEAAWLTNDARSAWSSRFVPSATVDSGGRIREIKLQNQGVKGEMPPELGNLHSLGILNLSGNEFFGEIPPELGNIARSLGELDLSNNQLTGEIPPELNGLSLRVLDLSHNQLTGEITPELEQLLVEILSKGGSPRVDLSYNLLTGRISRESPLLSLDPSFLEAGLGKLVGNRIQVPHKTVLYDIFGTRLAPEGNLDTPLSEWTGVTVDSTNQVTELRIENRDIDGLELSLGFLYSLKILDLSGNRIQSLISELGLLTNLEVLDLSDNRLYTLEARGGPSITTTLCRKGSLLPSCHKLSQPS